ncbi:RNA-binding protein L [Diospyros lotus]|uniref:RNA-binding protein L n=1 Tax=Diospyros lotus TaxID=55363 RepID=UPI002251EFC2|nr:RNA-binding protein L [Diospyros lotus]
MDDMAAYFQPPPPGLHRYAYYQHTPPHPTPPLAPVDPSQPPLHHLPQQLPPYPQPSLASSYTSALHAHSSFDHVRTLFVAGLPEDVKPREIYNLFREFPGYESSHLRTATSSSQPFAFAVFMDQQSAVTALQALNGMVFDLEKGSTLYIDLAKSNSRSKRSRIDDGKPGSEKRIRESATFARGGSDTGVGSILMPGIGNSAYNTIGYPSTQSYANFEGRALNEATTAKMNNSSAPHMSQNVTPCPTLFVASLGPTCSEEELIQVFSSCPGFLKLKMQSTYGAPVAFVDFRDTACSTEALSRLQGTILYSSPPGEGMRLEYARSRMGMRSKKSR